MYCTVKFCKSLKNENYEKLLNLFSQKFSFRCNNQYLKASSINFTYQGWNFWLNENKLKGIGSLTKLYFGDNVQNASFSQIKQALAQVESLVELSLNDAIIQRLDIGYTLSLSEEPSKYLKILGTPSGYKRHISGDYETCHFEKKEKNDLKFYDKNLESFSTKDYQKLYKEGNHRLRFELEIQKNVSKFLKLPCLTWGNLYEKGIYNQLTECWYNEFLTIPELLGVDLLNVDYSSLKNFKNSLAQESIFRNGGIHVFQNAAHKKNVDKHSRHNINGFLNQLEPPKYQQSKYKSELDEKIWLAYKDAKSELGIMLNI